MPTYEYKCGKCEEVFEIFQKMTDAPLRECPVCGGELKKVVSGGIGIIFKGSGFYTTDYKNSSALSSSASKPGKEADRESGQESDRSAGKKTPDTSSVSAK